jgi:hypothetical protein
MHTPTRFANSQWSTASYGSSTDMSPLEVSALGDHLTLCRGLSGRLFALRCGAESLRSFVLARLVSSALVLALLAGIGVATL